MQRIACWLAALGVACSAQQPQGESSTGADDGGDSTSSLATASTSTGTSAQPDTVTSDASTTSAAADDSSSSAAEQTSSGGSREADIPTSAWSRGLAPQRVLGPDLVDLPGGLEGDPLWVSNNPERVFGPGWLMQHARVDAQRGGSALGLTALVAYMFHLNASGAPLVFHLIATNPGEADVDLEAHGSLYDNARFPITPGQGPSVAVAEDALTGKGSVDTTVVVSPGQGVELASIDLAPGGILDGRVRIEASGELYVYMVATASGSTDEAINRSQGEPAPGEILQPGPNAFGRMAGVYANARWAGAFEVDVPAAPAHVGLALNTTDKFQLDGATLQSQSAPAIVNLSDSSDESFGNYGMAYDLVLRLCADEGARTVALRFGSNFVADDDTPSFTWAGPVRLLGELVDVLTTPTAPSMELGEQTIAARSCVDVDLSFVVPGLITGGQQLVLESR